MGWYHDKSKMLMKVLGAVVGVLVVLLTWGASRVWAQGDDHEKRLTTVEAVQHDQGELLREVRDDVKTLLGRIHD